MVVDGRRSQDFNAAILEFLNHLDEDEHAAMV